MWTATIDFMKAFDSITHKSIWNALNSCGIKHDCISLLEKVDRDQKASVQTVEESNMFEIKKGTNQGDPLSSLLLNMVLQKALEDGIPRWQKKKGMGIYLSDNDIDCLTNLRFADDVLLFASSKEQLQKMLSEFNKSTEKVGLRIHPEKTKILSNQSNQSSDTKKKIEVDDIRVEILTRGESARYLGQTITFLQQETTEIRNRIRAACATLHKYRHELTSTNYMLKHPLQLFDAVITKEHERMIQSTQRIMFRLIIQTKRRFQKIVKQKVKTNEEKDTNDLSSTGDESEDKAQTLTKTRTATCHSRTILKKKLTLQRFEEEDWIEYIKRSTNDAIEKMGNAKIRCCNKTHKK